MMIAKQNGGTSNAEAKAKSLGYRLGKLIAAFVTLVTVIVMGRLAWNVSTWLLERMP